MTNEGDYQPDDAAWRGESLAWDDQGRWAWLNWDWKRHGFIAEAVSTATVIIGLALTYLALQSLVVARYEARLNAGSMANSAPWYGNKSDPEFKDLLARLQALDEALAKSRSVAQAAAPVAAPQVLPPKVVAPVPPPAMPPKVAEAPPPAIAPQLSVQTAILNQPVLDQPVLRLQPGLRTGAPAPSPYSERVWFSQTYRPGDSRLVSLVAAGDTMMGSVTASLNPDLRPGTDAAGVVGNDLAQIFRAADVAFVNLEGTLYDGSAPSAKSGCANCFSFKSPEFYASILASLGIDVVSLANNHSGDFGAAGRLSSVAALKNEGIAAAGLDQDGMRSATLQLESGKRVAIVAFAPNAGTLDLNDLPAAVAEVRRLARTHDLVVVSFHGGAEGWSAVRVPKASEYFLGENRGNVTGFAHAMIDAGAAMVVGHGPHVPRALEIYKGRLIAYSLGNFWTYGVVMNYAVSGLGPVVEAWMAPDGTLAGLQIHSTRQAGLGVPHLDPLDEAARYVMYLTKNDFPSTWDRLKGARDSAIARSSGGAPPS